MDFQDLCALSDEELAEWDIGELNLGIAAGLPSGTVWEATECQDTLNEWVDFVRRGTENAFRRFRHRYPDDSDAQFQILALATLVQRNLGARYNRTFMEGEYDGRDSCNLFIHGLLTGRGGSCVSMPVLTVAIGRRLGYPLRLVEAKLHTFCRWDDPSSGERFNIDATSGFGEHPDSYYRSWPKTISPQETRFGYLQSLTPGQEAALFLCQRGTCCLEHLQIRRAVEALHAAHQLHPRFLAYRYMWGVALVMHRIFGDQVIAADHVDPEEITRRRDDLAGEFSPSIVNRTRRELDRIVTNWRTRPAFPPPRFDVSVGNASAQPAI